MLERGILAMNGARTLRQPSPPSEDMSEGSDVLSNPSYDIITEDVSRFTTQYYTTVEPQGSPQMAEHTLTPKDHSSTSGSSSSGGSKSTSTSSDEGQGVSLGHQGSPNIRKRTTSPDIASSAPSPVRSMCATLPTSTASNNDSSSVKHWSYEEQFKQLYNLSDDPERKEFLDKLFDYMQKKGTPITRVPIMAKQPLDLYRLFKLVVERGGLVEVIKKKAWRAVAKELNLPASITSAAFTMRSQYVKYLYPYECEVEKLSDPQELQMAIDSNKRDRRHSETVEFISQPITACRNELESLAPVTQAVTAAQGLQIINSPTVALPHGSIPPYSGGFIVTQGPGGTQMVAPQISGPPQLVQMTTHPQGIPIMVPAIATTKQEPSRTLMDDRDDASSQASSEASEREPPAKRIALDTGRTITSTGKLATMAPSSFVMTPTGHMVPTSHFNAHSPQIVQMGTHPHIPLVMPTSSVTSYTSKSSPVETQAGNNIILKEDTPRRSPLENGIAPHMLSSGNPKRTQVISASHLLQMAPPSHVPLVLPTLPSHLERKVNDPSESGDPLGRHAERKRSGGDTSVPSSLKMPFANISIQSANKDGESGDASTLLVTLEINNTVFQGVLFAKPPSVSPSR